MLSKNVYLIIEIKHKESLTITTVWLEISFLVVLLTRFDDKGKLKVIPEHSDIVLFTFKFVILLLLSALIPNNELSAYLKTLLSLYTLLYCS